MEAYLKEHYHDQITNVLNEPNDRTHAVLQVDLSLLQQHNFNWLQAILNDVYVELPKWDDAFFSAQRSIVSEDDAFLDEGYQIKSNCHVRFVHLPASDRRFKIPFPNNDQVGLFRDVKGTVVRMSQVKLLEVKRDFICSKCATVITIEADYSLMYRFDVPKNCPSADCKGNMHQKDAEPKPEYCVNYQELKIQEALSEKNIPPTLVVTLDADLVDCCQPGDCVTICGTVERRWLSFNESMVDAVIAMRAVSLVREQNNLTVENSSLSEQMMSIKADWHEQLNKHGELGMRDIILKSICPDVYGMYPVKLAIVLAICSGNDMGDTKSSDGLHQRGQSHILMVGDPGLAKSKLLLSAVAIAPRAVHTTGMGCSLAGLTAAAIKEDGEWVLEAGALVLADGGICCIDEFNLMRESDRASIHEAMEQQTISMAKAGIVCKLNTRCAILAAANPKNLHAMSEPEGTSSINIGIATPLLSRFDLVLILKDERIPEWDDAIADHLLAQVTTGFQEILIKKDAELWDTQKLQTHFAAVSQVQPKMTPIATAILGAYYRKCRSDPLRDQSRTTVRLLDSLNRLAEAHARLVFREWVTVIDSIVTIRLMESTFGFGRIIKPYDIIKEELPLGPGEEEIQCILEILEIYEKPYDEDVKSSNQESGYGSTSSSKSSSHNVSETIQSSQKSSIQNHCSQNQPFNDNKTQKETQNPIVQNVIQQNITSQLTTQQAPHAHVPTQTSTQLSTRSPIQLLTRPPTQAAVRTVTQVPKPDLPAGPCQFKQLKSQRIQPSSFQAVVDMDPEELDELLSFDNVISSKKEENHPKKDQASTSTQKEDNRKHAMSDDEDMILSQVLDNLERSQKPIGEPEPKIPKLDFKRPNRLSLNLSRFKSAIPKPVSKENTGPSTIKPSTLVAKEPPSDQNESQVMNKSIRSRIMCTPSDDESSQNEQSNHKLSTTTLNLLNKFKFKETPNKNQPLQQQNVQQKNVQQQNVEVTSKSDNTQPENDSAYDTMIDSSLPSVASASCKRTGKTPALFAPSGETQDKNDEDDLSFLDTLEFT